MKIETTGDLQIIIDTQNRIIDRQVKSIDTQNEALLAQNSTIEAQNRCTLARYPPHPLKAHGLLPAATVEKTSQAN